MSPLDNGERQSLLEIARRAVIEAVERRRPIKIDPLPGNLSQAAGVFVTLKVDRKLRGCIGRLEVAEPLSQAVADAAQLAACQDPRFKPMKPVELPHLGVEISVLSPLERIEPARIEVGRHGLMIRRGGFRGLLLPQVAVEHHWNSEEFLEETCMKAGLPADAWREPRTEILGFTAEIFSDAAV
jgi:AmmeMemoRadiSam system protein A